MRILDVVSQSPLLLHLLTPQYLMTRGGQGCVHGCQGQCDLLPGWHGDLLDKNLASFLHQLSLHKKVNYMHYICAERDLKWAVLRKKVPYVRSHCHIKPSFGMTRTFKKNIYI